VAEINSLGYLGFGVRDLDRWKALAVDVLGMQLGCEVPGERLALRLDELAQRIVLEKSDDDDLDYVGWLFKTESELETFVNNAVDKGLTITRCSNELVAQRRVEKAYCCEDPNGLRHEFAFGPAYAVEPFASSVLKGRFVTGSLGLGHILVVAKNYQETLRFCQDALGLRVTDFIRAPLETPRGVIDVDATFMHTRTGRHHSLATAQIPVPKRLHHLMIEVSDINDVGLALDRCKAAGFPIAMDLGHHPNDDMVSFYVQAPSGNLIELGWGGRVVDDANWEIRTYGQLSDWGHGH